MSRRLKANAVFTCITFTRVILQHGRALRTSAGVSTRPEETEMAAYIFTRVGYWKKKTTILDLVESWRERSWNLMCLSKSALSDLSGCVGAPGKCGLASARG